MINNPTTQILECLRYLSSQCDGAHDKDGVGFNGRDTEFGKSLATRRMLTARQESAALKMLQTYRKQIESAGLQLPYPQNTGYAVPQQEEDAPVILAPQPTTSTSTTEGITLSAQQRALFEIMENTEQHLFITGRAGTGKSVLSEYFRDHTTKTVMVTAPTGIAALNVRGQTIHSLFRIEKGLYQKGDLDRNSRVCSILRQMKTLIIDEISMVRADLLEAINDRLQEAFGNNLPFGGVQVIMFGDVYQLPPVVDEGLMPHFEKKYGGYFFFNANVWKRADANFSIYELTQVFRQKDPVFKEVLNAVRDGSVSDDQIDQLNARCGVPIPLEGVVTLATTNNLVADINKQRLAQLDGKMYKYQAVKTGMVKTFPTEEILELKKGAQVVMLRNDKDKRWVNGTVAIIDEIDEKQVNVRIEGIVYTLETVTWEDVKYEYDYDTEEVEAKVTSSFTQYPIRLAWAMTIHKSQGQTYQSAALDLTTATFAPGQLYVALSRCTSLEGLYLKMPVKRAHIMVEPKVQAFMERRASIVIETTVETPVVEEIVEPPQQEELWMQNYTEETTVVESVAIEEVSQPQNTEPKKKHAGGRPRKGLKETHVSLTPMNMEHTKEGKKRSELINIFLDAYRGDSELVLSTEQLAIIARLLK